MRMKLHFYSANMRSNRDVLSYWQWGERDFFALSLTILWECLNMDIYAIGRR